MIAKKKRNLWRRLSNFEKRSKYRYANLVERNSILTGRDPFNQNFRQFQSKTQWIGSVQPEKFRKNWSTLRWTTFPGRNFGWMVCVHTVLLRDQVLISLFILLQVLLSSWCLTWDQALFFIQILLLWLPKTDYRGKGRGHDRRLLDAVREKYSYISHASFHFICVWLKTRSTITSWLLSAWGIRLSDVEFNREFMKLTKFVCDLST